MDLLLASQSQEKNRREDIMNSVLRPAMELVYHVNIKKAELSDAKKPKRQYLAWGLFVSGACWHWLVSVGDHFDLDFGHLLMLAGITYWGQVILSVDRLEKQLNHFQEKFSDLSIVWAGASSVDTLPELFAFVDEIGQVEESDQFYQWRHSSIQAAHNRVEPN